MVLSPIFKIGPCLEPLLEMLLAVTGFVRESRGVLEPLIRDKSDYPSINIQKIYIYKKKKKG
jgi:hypothetical protein